MSAYRDQKTKITDGDALMTALCQMKSLGTGQCFKPVRHSIAMQLEGYHGDKRKQTAEIIIPRAQVQGAANDIGFKRAADGTYTAIISEFDSARYNAAWLTEVKQKTLEARAMKKAKTQPGMRLESREVQKDGSIRLSYVQA